MSVLIALILALASFSLEGRTPAEMRNLWKEEMKTVPEYPEGKFEGRGIVIAAGGEHYLINAWISLNLLRYHGCQLPVEIWYIGQEEYIPSYMDLLRGLDAECRDITEHFPYPIKGWEVKVHAILASSFQEVMLLDADNICLADPAYLFDAEEYMTTGALFWPMGELISAENPLLNVLELPRRAYRAQESGILIIDKKPGWRAMQLCAHMNKNSDFYYKHIYGDKDTFFLSYLTTNTPYSMVNHLPGYVYSAPFAGNMIGFLQRDCQGEPLFCHDAFKNWAERKDQQLYWKYYNLPHESSDDMNARIPLCRPPLFSFRDQFGTIEMKCIALLRKVKPDLPYKGKN